MTETTARFALPFILPGQAQKELYHNEALARVDMALHAAVEGDPLTSPPPAPAEGQCWMIGAGAEGDWSGRDDCLAVWTAGGWRYLAPVPGMMAWRKDAGHWIHWNGTAWSSGSLPVAALEICGKQVVGQRQETILNPSGGTVIDAEARAALDAVLVTLKSHGLIE